MAAIIQKNITESHETEGAEGGGERLEKQTELGGETPGPIK